MTEEKPEELWPEISDEERTLHEILFYSQGPVDGYILGEGIRDLLLKSGLSLTVLSQIWNLADVSNDNVLNVDEFVLIMHLIRGVMSGRAVPKALPRTLTPPQSVPQTTPPMTQQEKDAYLRVFQTLDYNRTGFISAQIAAEVFLATHLPIDVLAHIWDLSDFSRDGKLNPEKFAIACHLLRYAKKGGSLDGPVDIFQYAPQYVSPLSLLARKRRVAEYEEHKQRLMSLKERRKVQAMRETRRLELAKNRLTCLQNLFELLKKLGKELAAEEHLQKIIAKDMADKEKQEEIALRLKKEHEKVRQETVKIILGEQKFNNDISIIKKDTDELNKKLLSAYTHATKDPDPFHQLYEQRREKRQGSTIKDLDKIDIHIPFEFSPFDLSITPETLPSGMDIINRGDNHQQPMAEITSVIADLKEFGENFMDLWGELAPLSKHKPNEFEDDEIFMEVHDWSDDNWPTWDWSEVGLLGLTEPEIVTVKDELCNLREELNQLNSGGGRLVFRKAEDYYARKKAIEEEEKVEKGRVKRRSVTERLRSGKSGSQRTRDTTNRYSYSGERKANASDIQAAIAAREYRLKRRSQTFDSSSSSPEILRNPDREKRLYRAQTDPASVSDEGSLSRESSISSFDHSSSLVGSSHKLEEESSTIRTQYSSKTNDSGILTFVSTDRKDNFCLDSPLEFVHPSKVDLYETAEKTTDQNIDCKLSQQNLKDSNNLRSVAVEEQQLDKEEGGRHAVHGTSADSCDLQEITRRSSKKHKAPAPPCSTSPPAPRDGEAVKAQVDSSNELLDVLSDGKTNEGNYNSHINQEVNNIKQSDIREHLAIENLENNEITRLTKTEETPQRPPRLKKRSTSERSHDLPSPTNIATATDTKSCVKEIVSVITYQPASAEREKKETDHSESSSTIYEAPTVQQQAISGHTSLDNKLKIDQSLTILNYDNNLPKISKTEKDFHDKKQEQIQTENTQSLAAFNSNGNIDTLTKTKTKDTSAEVMATQTEIRIQLSQSSVTSSTTEASKKRVISDFSKEETLGDDVGTNSFVDAGVDGSPPPLPSSAPPPLPSEPPPTTGHNGEIEAEVVTVEYSVPIISSSKSSEDNELQETHAQIHSSAHLNNLAKTHSNDYVPAIVKTSRNVSLPEDRKDKEPQIESPSTSKTISDLRSDFFGLKSRRPHKDVIEPDLTDTSTRLSRDFYFNDLQVEDKISRKPGPENSLDSDISDADSGIPLSMDVDTFSPGDSGRFSMGTVVTPDENSGSKPFFNSRETNNKLSKKSTASDSGSVVSASSATKSQSPPACLDDSQVTPKKQNHNSSNQETTSRFSASSGSLTVSSELKSSPATSSKSFTRMRSSDNIETAPTKKTTTTKKEVIVTSAGDILPELQTERLDAMVQSRVKRKVNVSLPVADKSEMIQESVNSFGSSLKKSNPSEYGFVYSAERPQPPPEAGWSEKQGSEQKVSLYSENVLKEGDTTESVDRASIANLETTKQQWEQIFIQSPTQVDASVKKKATPKWEVRLPYTERHSGSSPSQGQNFDNPSSPDSREEEDQIMFKKPVSTESAIEREIRLAHEREEMLRREKEEREKLVQQQKIHGQNSMASYVTSSAESESNQPAFHELAEADRNPDLWRAEHEDKSEENSIVNPNESIIEREIRLQRERELEFASMRKRQQTEPQQPEQHVTMQSQQQPAPRVEKEDINHNQTKTASHREPAARSSNEVENRIVKELLELREREEEIKRIHSSLHRTQITDENEVDEIDGIDNTSQYSSSVTTNSQGLLSPSGQVSWQRDVSAFLTPLRRESVDSLSSQSTGRSPSDIISSRREVKVHPIADSYDDEEDQKPDYFKKQETPIEREIRLARERENELRKQKGLPEIDFKESNTYSSYSGTQEPSNNISTYKPTSVQSGNTMQKFASSRLQQELQEQKERELALLSEGKIISTSEQHIPSLKYAEVSVPEKSDGTLKRNFASKKSNVSYNESDLPQRPQEPTTPTASSTKRTSTVGAGGQLFSYREFRQTAESKIERELREMKEREEELRKQRSGAVPESPH